MERVLKELEEYLLKTYEFYKDSNDIKDYTIANQCMFIYNYLQKLKGDKEWVKKISYFYIIY